MRSAIPTIISGRSFRVACRYSSASNWRNPTDVKMEIEVGEFGVGQATGGCRRVPMINRRSSGAQMNLRSADSCGAAGVLYNGGPPCFFSFSITDLSPDGRCWVSGEFLWAISGNPEAYSLLTRYIHFQRWYGLVLHHARDGVQRLAS